MVIFQFMPQQFVIYQLLSAILILYALSIVELLIMIEINVFYGL